jgi:bifunctional non-homologous end joining protein LigD
MEFYREETMKEKEVFEAEGKKVALTHQDKIFFAKLEATKADVIEYYMRVSRYILPYLKGRPFSMLHYPDGIDGKSFFRKQRPDGAPKWLESKKLSSGKKKVDWCLVNDLPSLIYMVNRSCIEMHAWFSRLPNPDRPDIAVFDIDPSGDTGFDEAVRGALAAKEALDDYGLWSIPKVSGKTGVHVIVPIKLTPYDKVRRFVKSICKNMETQKPDLFTTERTLKKRGNRVYLDAVQNGRGKTLPAPYSLRATPEATVSAPVTWEELKEGVRPELFTMRNMEKRLEEKGDLFEPVYEKRQKLPKI